MKSKKLIQLSRAQKLRVVGIAQSFATVSSAQFAQGVMNSAVNENNAQLPFLFQPKFGEIPYSIMHTIVRNKHAALVAEVSRKAQNGTQTHATPLPLPNAFLPFNTFPQPFSIQVPHQSFTVGVAPSQSRPAQCIQKKKRGRPRKTRLTREDVALLSVLPRAQKVTSPGPAIQEVDSSSDEDCNALNSVET